MPNSDLLGKKYEVDDEDIAKSLGNNLSYENMKKIKSEMESYKKENNMDKFNEKGGEKALNWINNMLEKDRDTIYLKKKVRMDAGEENQFKKPHEKDMKNRNPTGVRIPKVKGSVNKQLTTNKITYEQELKKIKYLIEYLSNNDKKQIL